MNDTSPAARPRLLSTKQLAEYLSISTATLRRLERRGDLPKPTKIAGMKRWDREIVDRWIDRLSGTSEDFDDPDEVLGL